MDPKWKVADREEERAEQLARRLSVSPVTAHLLLRMGYDDPTQAQEFMKPSLQDLHDPTRDPTVLPNLDPAVDRLERAIAEGEPILVFGDYDVDGTTGAAVLWEVLTALGARVEVHIPDREEGYGLNMARMTRAADEGVRIVISVDNGISAIAEASFLKERGLDLIVCDHHTLGDELPEAVALVHPRLPGTNCPNPNLCGAGVAFKLAWAVAARLGQGRATHALRRVLKRCLALVALGTVADVVSLTGENRVLVRWGLKVMSDLAQDPSSPGIAKLLEISRITDEPDSTDVAFRLAPRLNAAGRMGSSRRAFDLLTTRDVSTAGRLARELDAENKRRREVQARVVGEADAQVREAYGAQPAAGVVAWGEGWPHGVVGIVAAKLTETFERPALVVSVEGELAKGSGRSVEGVDLLAALEPHRDLFERMGGHQAAVGFTIRTERLDELRDLFPLGVKASLGLEPDAPVREVCARLGGYEVVADVQVDLEEVSRQLLDELDQLSPFGEGNPEPLFAMRDVTLAGEPRLMGNTGQHVSFMLKQGERVVRTVAFSRPDVFELLQARGGPRPGNPPTFDVAFRPRLNRWQGMARVELELHAIVPCPDP